MKNYIVLTTHQNWQNYRNIYVDPDSIDAVQEYECTQSDIEMNTALYIGHHQILVKESCIWVTGRIVSFRSGQAVP